MIPVRFPLIKAWGMKHFTPQGAAMIRNPPATAFRPPTEEDVPAFAHAEGQIVDGEFAPGEHGELHYNTPIGSYQHGIDAAATRLGWFLEKHGIKANPVDLINQSIQLFNQNHTSHKGDDDKNNGMHALPAFDNMAWRKIRAGMLPPGDTAQKATPNAQQKPKMVL